MKPPEVLADLCLGSAFHDTLLLCSGRRPERPWEERDSRCICHEHQRAEGLHLLGCQVRTSSFRIRPPPVTWTCWRHRAAACHPIANFFGHASCKRPFESATCSETRLVVVRLRNLACRRTAETFHSFSVVAQNPVYQTVCILAHRHCHCPKQMWPSFHATD